MFAMFQQKGKPVNGLMFLLLVISAWISTSTAKGSTDGLARNISAAVEDWVGARRIRSAWLGHTSSRCERGYVLGDELHGRLIELANVSESTSGLSRPYLSDAGQVAALLISDYMRDAGMDVRIDIVGNVVGVYTPSLVDDEQALLLSSHFDTVQLAGKYDGAYGVLASIAVVKMLHCAGLGYGRKSPVPLVRFPIHVLAFDDEEGNNAFGTTQTGAKTYAGMLGESALQYLARYPAFETALRARLAAAGRADASRADLADTLEDCKDKSLRDRRGFLEIHIEQGPVLETTNLPLGVVTSINGQSRLVVTFTGRASHAGTTPMDLRSDALVAASATILYVHEKARDMGSLVATVGALHISDAASNTVPGHVVMTLDVRSPEDARRQAVVQDILRYASEKASIMGVSVDSKVIHEAPAVPMAPQIQVAFENAIKATGTPVTHLSSGAGHDAMILARKVDTGMLFVRCRDGISHHPDEFLSFEDMRLGAEVLLETVLSFDTVLPPDKDEL